MPPTRRTKKEKKAEVCRICLSAKDDRRIPLHADSEWTRLLEYCVGISVKSVNGPQIICDGCSKKLQDFSDFKTLALKSDTLWNNIWSVNIKKGFVEVPIEYHTNTNTIHIKDEVEESIGSNQGAEEYLDDGFRDEPDPDPEWIPDDEIKKQEEEDLIKDEIELTEHNVKAGTEFQTKKTKKQKGSGKASKEDLKGLTNTQFINKFFEVISSKKKVKYECIRCGEELTRHKALLLHVQKCSESEVLIVKKTNQQQKRQDTEKTPPSIFDCGLCDFQNANEDIVMEHVNENHCSANDLTCKLCNFVGRDMADVIVHRYKHMPQEFKYKYRCPTCNQVRLNELCLQFHYRSLHLKKEGGWCSFCNKTFTGYIYFRNHMRLHMEQKYVCDLCGQKFLFRNLIEAHIKEHMNVRNYVCDTCGKSFKRNNALQGHQSVHTNSPVICEHCGKTFKNEYNYQLHIQFVRKEEKFACEVCFKKFKLAHHLKLHMIAHSNDKPFMCNYCGRNYKMKSALKMHMRTHLGVFAFKCETCDKEFVSSPQLSRHQSVHTGIRKVKCLVCDDTFYDKKLMLKHFQKKHIK